MQMKHQRQATWPWKGTLGSNVGSLLLATFEKSTILHSVFYGYSAMKKKKKKTSEKRHPTISQRIGLEGTCKMTTKLLHENNSDSIPHKVSLLLAANSHSVTRCPWFCLKNIYTLNRSSLFRVLYHPTRWNPHRLLRGESCPSSFLGPFLSHYNPYKTSQRDLEKHIIPVILVLFGPKSSQ